MNYRPEIDGLRAIAVLAVIANHFSESVLPGGYLGVDVFFVISGYVITRSLLARSVDNAGAFFLDFYSRRVKRILPALVVCVLVTTLIGSLFIEPNSPEYENSLKTGMFALFGLSNIFLYLQAIDYFGTAAELNIFTHTWSLGVEEQFYFVYPPLLFFTSAAFVSRTVRIAVLTGLTLASLFLFAWYTKTDLAAAYYIVFARFWELSIGCLIAVLWKDGHSRLRYIPWLGGAALLIAFSLEAERILYATPLAVFGTAAIISMIRPGDQAFRFLTWKPMTLIGLISYSLYLWHWPVIALSRWTIGIDEYTLLPQLFIMFGLATISYRYLENPLRQATWSSRRLSTIGYGFGGATIVMAISAGLLAGVIGPFYTGQSIALAAKGVATLKDEKFYQGELIWRAEDCVLSSDDDVGKEISWEACMIKTLPDANPEEKFLVIGNSYSAALFEMYSVLAEKGVGRVVATSSWGASQVPELVSRNRWSKANDYYWDTVVPELTAQLGEGDFVLMLNNNSRHVTKSGKNSGTDRENLRIGLKKFAAQMEQKGVSVVFLSQISVMPELRCAPDMAVSQWFERRDKGGVSVLYQRVYQAAYSTPA